MGLPEGHKVTVVVRSSNGAEKLLPGEGLRRSAGVWSDDIAGPDEYLEWNRQRKQSRRGIEDSPLAQGTGE
jgi:hypothetical protein